METLPEPILSLDLPCDPDAPGIVRAALAEMDRLRDVVSDVMLVASELVTNAVVHSGCRREHELAVRAYVNGDRMMISVHVVLIVDLADEVGGLGDERVLVELIGEALQQCGGEPVDRGERGGGELLGVLAFGQGAGSGRGGVAREPVGRGRKEIEHLRPPLAHRGGRPGRPSTLGGERDVLELDPAGEYVGEVLTDALLVLGR